jgi:flagellar biosynthesis/type III secretory pathway chaperone
MTAFTGRILATELDALLSALRDLYESLGQRLDEHQSAIRAANTRAIDAAVQAEQQLLDRLAGMEQKRREVVAKAASAHPALAKAHGNQITLSMLAALTPEQQRLAAFAESLRQLIDRVNSKLKIIREATAQLLTHMQAIASQVSAGFNHARTYGRAGKVDAGPAVVSALDLRS